MLDNKFIDAYWKFRRREITSMREFGIYLGHCEYYHKCIYAYSKEYEASDEYKIELEKQLKKNPYLRGTISDRACFNEKSRGRKGEKGITDKFKEVYWDYENYKISPIEAYELTGYSKNWFHKVSLDYEKSPYYKDDIKKHPEVMKKPERTQAVPIDFKKDAMTMTDEELSVKYNYHICKVQRLRLKTNRKAVWDAIKENSQK